MNMLWQNLFRKTDEAAQVTDALKHNYLFQSLTKRELAIVQSTVHVRAFEPGENVFRQGDPGSGMYIVLQGAIEVLVEPIHAGAPGSSPRVVTRLQGGDFFGELSLVETDSRRTASAVATEASLLIGFFKPDLFEIMERQPTVGVKILLRLSEVLGRRLKETTHTVTEFKEAARRAVDVR